MTPLPLALLAPSMLALSSIAACAPIAAQDPAPENGVEAGSPEESAGAEPANAEVCRAEPAQRFIGRKPDADTVRAAMAASGAKTVRVIEHDMMVTLDYREDRLNLRLDESGTIVAVDCG